jgi:hypothetical protein
LGGILLAGCAPSGVGDPCTPEQIPEGGFNQSEVYVETSSVQCRTRVCLVFGLGGDPTNTQPDCPKGAESCVDQDEVDQRVTCSCRCRAPEGSNTPTCDCPSGFRCPEDPLLTQGEEGIRGSYCVREEVLCEDLDPKPDYCDS